MAISSEQFRDTLRHFASGVTLVTAGRGDEIHGMTVSAFSSVSADPPLVAVFVDRAHGIHPFLEDDDAPLAVNILAEDQAELSQRFAFTRDENRFLPRPQAAPLIYWNRDYRRLAPPAADTTADEGAP